MQTYLFVHGLKIVHAAIIGQIVLDEVMLYEDVLLYEVTEVNEALIQETIGRDVEIDDSNLPTQIVDKIKRFKPDFWLPFPCAQVHFVFVPKYIQSDMGTRLPSEIFLS